MRHVDPRSKRYTFEQSAYMVEQYFRTSSYKIALGASKRSLRRCQTLKRSELLKDSKPLEDEPRSGRLHTLSDEDQTELREHTEEHPGTSAHRTAQQLGYKRETVWKTLKEEGLFPHQISVLHELKPEDYSPLYDY